MRQTNELLVVARSLQEAAGIWDQQATAIGSVSATVAAMSLGRVDAGVFQLIVGPYESIVAQVSARCEEGSRDMRSIATALDQAAGDYMQAEHANVTNIRSVQALAGLRP